MSTEPTFTQRLDELEQAFKTHPPLRAVNFHSSSPLNREAYDRQLEQYARNFSSVNEAEMRDYLATGQWHKSKPGLIISVFEGYRNSFEILHPLIEKHGFIGWYWIITGFIDTPVAKQLDYAQHHDIDMLTHDYPDGRYALSWDEIRELDKKHVIACHSRSHMLLSQFAKPERREEIVGSQDRLRKQLGHPVNSFVSLYGPAYGEDGITDELVREAGFEFVLGNSRIQRIRSS
jgi:peptidoglycan/xylan/chitin deacetylase (PgdA/CDA1 family)